MPKNPFIPPKLPPQINYNNLVSDLGNARASIARLDEVLTHLKNPRLLARTFATKEAVLSSQIEGTEATMAEVFEQEAKGLAPENTSKGRDITEIINYRKALEKGIEILKDKPLTENVIKELHKILLYSARGHNKGPGEFRKKLVYIAKPGLTIENATYIPPLPDEIPDLFSNLEKYIHSSEERDRLVQIAVAHYQFEAIHPFEDGNGRIGRLLISLMLYDKKFVSYPYIYLSEFFEEHRREYYDLLLGVSEGGDWESWVSFFLRGLNIQADRAQETAKKILDLHQKIKEDIPKFNSKYAHDFLDALFSSTIFTSRSLRLHSHIRNHLVLYSLISKFLKAGIIRDLTLQQKRNKIYRFDELAKILGK